MICAIFLIFPVVIGVLPDITRQALRQPAATQIVFGCAVVVFYALIGAVFMGWRARGIAPRVHPNEGIRLFTRNMLRGGLVVGAVAGGVVCIAIAAGLAQKAGFASAAIAGLLIGIVIGSYFAVIGALWFGAIDVINHYVLRGILWITGQVPLRLIRYLDGAVEICPAATQTLPIRRRSRP